MKSCNCRSEVFHLRGRPTIEIQAKCCSFATAWKASIVARYCAYSRYDYEDLHILISFDARSCGQPSGCGLCALVSRQLYPCISFKNAGVLYQASLPAQIGEQRRSGLRRRRARKSRRRREPAGGVAGAERQHRDYAAAVGDGGV